MNIIENTLEFGKMDIRKSTERLILHHADASKCSVEDIHRWHKGRGWSGIGYHFLIRKNGSIYRGRPENTIGAHAGGSNFNSIGICFEGNFEIEEMGEEQIKAGQELMQYLKDKYGITLVQKHKDVCKTSCPGAKFPFEKLTQKVSEVKQEPKKVSNTTNAVLLKNNNVGIWQRKMNSAYNCGLSVDNCFGNDCKAKANKYYLRKGNKNIVVGFIQTLLNAKGFSCGKVDNIFGDKTRNAVISFQKNRGLAVDGCVGANTTIELLK